MVKASDVGFLLIHGLGSNNQAMKPLEQFLTDEGNIVDNINLPGFSTTPKDLQSTTWLDWISYAQERLTILKNQCTSFYIVGTSLGV